MLFLLFPGLVMAKDSGQWKYAAPDLKAWFESLRMPDYPGTPCCGEGDGYWADEAATGPNGELLAVITDTRDDAKLHRVHIPVGTKIPVPPEKIRKVPVANPTGHTYVFIGVFNDGSRVSYTVYCFEPMPSI